MNRRKEEDANKIRLNKKKGGFERVAQIHQGVERRKNANEAKKTLSSKR